MPRHAAWMVTAFAVVLGVAPAGGDESPVPTTVGRVVEGTVIGADRVPIGGARLFFGPTNRGLRLDEEAATDDRGHYRVDLGRSPWLTGEVRALLLAPGYRLVDRALGADRGSSIVDFELEPQPWKETILRFEDPEGRPVGGVEVTTTVAGNEARIWSRSRTDAEGRCRVAMAPGMPIGLSVKPEGARPIITYLGAEPDEPDAITLPILAPIRGRVVDPGGRPVADAAVGGVISFGIGGEGTMFAP